MHLRKTKGLQGKFFLKNVSIFGADSHFMLFLLQKYSTWSDRLFIQLASPSQCGLLKALIYLNVSVIAQNKTVTFADYRLFFRHKMEREVFLKMEKNLKVEMTPCE